MPTHLNLPVLNILYESGHRDEVKENRSQGDHYRTICPFCRYSSKTSPYGTFSIHADGQRWTCYCCGAKGGTAKVKQLLGSGWEAPIRDPELIKRRESAPKTRRERQLAQAEAKEIQGVTLAGFTSAKGLDLEFVQSVHNWKEGPLKRDGKTHQIVHIPYYDGSGKLTAVRRRLGLDRGNRFEWRKGSKVIPYGLPFLDKAKESGYVILVEGETDFVTLHYHGIPALGIAGATLFKDTDPEYLVDIEQIYVWREPDSAGTGFVQSIATKCKGRTIKVLSSPAAKDPCELAQLTGPKFVATMHSLMEQAEVYEPPEPEPDHGPGIFTDTERQALKDSIAAGGAGLNADSVLPSGGIKTTTRVNTVSKDPVTGLETWTAESKQRSMVALYFEQSKEFANRLATKDSKIDMIVYREIPNYGHVDFPLFPMENRRIFPSKEDLTHWLEFADGRWAKGWIPGIDEVGPEGPPRNPKVKAQESCLCNGFMTCDVHGHRFDSVGTCGGKQDPSCGSVRAREIGSVNLPEGNYRIVWHRLPIILGPQDDREWWGNAVNQAWQRVQKEIGRVNTRIKGRKKLNQSRLIHRTAGLHMDWPETTMHVKCTYWEEEPGALDHDIARFERETGAELLWDSVTDDRTVAQLHMVGAATASLISVDRTNQHSEETRTHLFAAYWEGTKGAHLNRVLDWLETLIKKTPKPPKPVCDVDDCGKELHWVLDTSLGDQTTNPTSPQYLWRRHPLDLVPD